MHNADEAIDFLASIPQIEMDKTMEDDVRDYIASDMPFPKRYKVKQKAYFILIKTTAETMLDFKQKKALNGVAEATGAMNAQGRKNATTSAASRLTETLPGWYEGEMDFKRVVYVPATGKHEYRDTHFVAQCKAMSGQDCYDRIVENLRQRVDERSQFPSAKGKNFRFRYLGMWKEQ